MTPSASGRMTDSDRMMLAAAMDRMIPAVDDLSGAGAMGLGRKVEQGAQRVPRLRSALVAVVDALSLDAASHAVGGFRALPPDSQDEALRLVETSMPRQFAVFLQLVYTVYYMEPAVHESIGWHGRPPQPEGYEMAPFDDAVLERARQREPFWRKV